jgi:hypothetical protein
VVYAVWLFWISLAFVVAERLWPWRKNQPLLRPGILSDLVYLVFNAEYLGILIALATQRLIKIYDPEPFIAWNLMAGKPKWLQFVVLLAVFDFPSVVRPQRPASHSLPVALPQGPSQHRRHGLARRLAFPLG